MAEHRRHVDDGAAARALHRRHGMFDAKEDAVEVDGNDLAPVAETEVDDGAGRADSRIVDEDVETAEFGFGSRHDLAPALFIGDVQRHGQNSLRPLHSGDVDIATYY